MGYKVAVVGATGNVGREMLNILDERKFPADEVVVLASRRSVGIEVSYGDRTLKVKALEHYDFSDIDICLMSAGGSVSKEWSPRIGAAGAVVIDNSSAWRMDPDVPLIVPEVNAEAIDVFLSIAMMTLPSGGMQVRSAWGVFRDRRPNLYWPLSTLDGDMPSQ